MVKVIPQDPAAATRDFPWIDYVGLWGQREASFYNGPTGPITKTQWNAPLSWVEEGRDRSYPVPAGGAFGTTATDFFCSAVGDRVGGVAACQREPRAGASRPDADGGVGDLGGEPDDLDAGESLAPDAAPNIEPELDRSVRADVRLAAVALSGHRSVDRYQPPSWRRSR